MNDNQGLTLEQQRANFAWSRAKKSTKIDEYTNTAKSTASLIMTSGLMQTLAFLQAKGGVKEKICTDIIYWLHERFSSGKNYQETMQYLFKCDSSTYMRINQEVMALLRWSRQMADALKSHSNGLKSDNEK